MPTSTSELVDEIYLAALAPERWPKLLSRIARAANGSDCVLAGVRGNSVRQVASSERYFDHNRMLLESYSGASNERTARLLSRDTDGFLTDTDVFSSEEIAHEPLYQECLIPAGYGAAAATAIRPPTGDIIILNVERAHAQGPFNPDEIALLNALRPHLARAALVANRLAFERTQATSAILEAMGVPVATTDARGMLVHANALFLSMVPTIFLLKSDRLALTAKAPNALFTATLDELASKPRARAGVSIPVPPNDAQPPVIVHVSPVMGSDWSVFDRAEIMIAATPVLPAQIPGTSVLRGLFDLTPSEARIARQIAGGVTVEKAAILLGISKETARSTLKSVFAKTGVNRQIDLSSLLRDLSIFRA